LLKVLTYSVLHSERPYNEQEFAYLRRAAGPGPLGSPGSPGGAAQRPTRRSNVKGRFTMGLGVVVTH